MRSRRAPTQVKQGEKSRAWHPFRGFWLQETKPLHKLEVTGSQDTKLEVGGMPGSVDGAANSITQIQGLPSSSSASSSRGSGIADCGIRSILCSPSEGKRNPGTLKSREELTQKLPEKNSSLIGQN